MENSRWKQAQLSLVDIALGIRAHLEAGTMNIDYVNSQIHPVAEISMRIFPGVLLAESQRRNSKDHASAESNNPAEPTTLPSDPAFQQRWITLTIPAETLTQLDTEKVSPVVKKRKVVTHHPMRAKRQRTSNKLAARIYGKPQRQSDRLLGRVLPEAQAEPETGKLGVTETAGITSNFDKVANVEETRQVIESPLHLDLDKAIKVAKRQSLTSDGSTIPKPTSNRSNLDVAAVDFEANMSKGSESQHDDPESSNHGRTKVFQHKSYSGGPGHSVETTDEEAAQQRESQQPTLCSQQTSHQRQIPRPPPYIPTSTDTERKGPVRGAFRLDSTKKSVHKE